MVKGTAVSCLTLNDSIELLRINYSILWKPSCLKKLLFFFRPYYSALVAAVQVAAQTTVI